MECTRRMSILVMLSSNVAMVLYCGVMINFTNRKLSKHLSLGSVCDMSALDNGVQIFLLTSQPTYQNKSGSQCVQGFFTVDNRQ